MIRFLKNCFSKSSTARLSNDERRVAASQTPITFASANNETTSNREERDDRTRPHRDVPSRPVTPPMPEIIKQPITITLSNGEITVEPLERDLFNGEQVEWICQQLAWEVRFDQAGSTTPFAVDIFGPGLIPPPVDPDTNPDLPPDEIPTELSGPIREDAEEGNYFYSAQVGGFGPLLARVKIIRRQRS
jgi:hypothetical protein